MSTKRYLFTAWLVICVAMANAQSTARTTASFNAAWKFYLGEANGASVENFNDATWRTVQLPHNWSIELPFDSMLPVKPWTPVLPTSLQAIADGLSAATILISAK